MTGERLRECLCAIDRGLDGSDSKLLAGFRRVSGFSCNIKKSLEDDCGIHERYRDSTLQGTGSVYPLVSREGLSQEKDELTFGKPEIVQRFCLSFISVLGSGGQSWGVLHSLTLMSSDPSAMPFLPSSSPPVLGCSCRLGAGPF